MLLLREAALVLPAWLLTRCLPHCQLPLLLLVSAAQTQMLLLLLVPAVLG
jgi:hypothetical protein